MERNGVAIDRDFFRGMSRDIEKVLVRLEKEIHALAGETFNINSPKQLSEILFTKLKLGKAKRTKSGCYSTDVEVLERLARAHELPRKLLDYRALFKLKSTYVDALIGMINSKTQRIHTSFNQTVAETGRLSSSEPNLQNIPIRDEYAREIRKGFIADKGNVILSGDYSQIELRLVAHLSKDEHLREAFARDEDVHTATASTVFGLKPEEVSPDLRRRAKAINFGIIYGMGPYGLSEALGISQEEAAAFIASYFLQYPKIKTWIDRTIAEARERGYVTTLLSRRRYLAEITSDNHQRRSFAERAAINTPIQGTAADLIKMAMIAIQKRIEVSLLRTKMILQVHDELVFEVPEAERESVRDMVKEEMEGTLSLDVPIKVEIGEGRNWYEAH
jgi:DNA polymerase-1